MLRTSSADCADDDRGSELLYEIVEDPEVYASLVKAGIVRPTLAMQAIQVLDGIGRTSRATTAMSSWCASRAATAYVRLLGACQGCGSSTTTLRDSVAEALLAHLPEISEVEEVPPEVAPSDTFVPVSALERSPERRPRADVAVSPLATATLRPLRWLGGASEFGLMLPDASPTPATMYAPRGACA